jgi:sec-independent protein translocase protein TatB
VFDIGWTELVVIACVTVLVVGPKELPGLLRSFGKTVGNLRRMAGDFQKQFDDAMREAELEEVRKKMNKPFQPLEDARKAALEFQEKVSSSVKIPPNEPSTGAGEAKPAEHTAAVPPAQIAVPTTAQLPAAPPPELGAPSLAVAEKPKAEVTASKASAGKSKAAAAGSRASTAAAAKSATKQVAKTSAGAKTNGAGTTTGRKA